jgi:hypothetical protein
MPGVLGLKRGVTPRVSPGEMISGSAGVGDCDALLLPGLLALEAPQEIPGLDRAEARPAQRCESKESERAADLWPTALRMAAAAGTSTMVASSQTLPITVKSPPEASPRAKRKGAASLRGSTR